MADVDSRGQVILVTGFAIAVILVAVVLLLNTVIYTENIATRGTDPSPAEALEFRDVAKDGLGELMIATNHEGYDVFSNVDSNYAAGVANLTMFLRASQIHRGSLAFLNNSSLTTTEGVLLQHQNSSRTFTSGGSSPGNTTWELANGVDATRRVRLVVERSTLESDDLTNLITNDAGFGVRVTDGTTNWTAYLYEDSGNITLGTTVNGANETVHCSVDADNATVALTGEGIVGVDCGNYDWAPGISTPYSIWYVNGNHAAGTYNLTVKGSSPEIGSNFNSSGGESPRALEAVYSATVTIRYESATLTYLDQIRVAPGEDDD